MQAALWGCTLAMKCFLLNAMQCLFFSLSQCLIFFDYVIYLNYVTYVTVMFLRKLLSLPKPDQVLSLPKPNQLALVPKSKPTVTHNINHMTLRVQYVEGTVRPKHKPTATASQLHKGLVRLSLLLSNVHICLFGNGALDVIENWPIQLCVLNKMSVLVK